MNPRIQRPTARAPHTKRPIHYPLLAAALGLKPVPNEPLNEPQVYVQSAWLEAPLGDDWCVALQLAVQDGQPVVSELRIFPAERPPQLLRADGEVEPFPYASGEWNGKWLGVGARVPRGGLTTTIVRKARISMLTELFEDIRKKLSSKGHDFFDYRLGFPDVKRDRGARGPGRPAVPLDALLPIAQDYAAAVAGGSRRPLQDIAQKDRRGVEEIRRRVRQARRRGLLTPAASSAAGGELTPEARRLIRQAKDGSQQRPTKSKTRRDRASSEPRRPQKR